MNHYVFAAVTKVLGNIGGLIKYMSFRFSDTALLLVINTSSKGCLLLDSVSRLEFVSYTFQLILWVDNKFVVHIMELDFQLVH